MKLFVKKLKEDIVGIIPYAHSTDAGLDLCASSEVELLPNIPTKVGTGIAVHIPDEHVGLVWDKSSIGSLGVKTLGGVIDAGYRGEIFIVMINLTKDKINFPAGKKIAQMIIQKYERVDIEYVNDLDVFTTRGDKGFGSTGN
jgi:dUTP pyrophosphatase